MIDSLTRSLDTTHVLRARIYAFVADASLVSWTIRADHTLWMTACDTRRNSLKAGQTLADCRVADLLADCVRSTWRW